MKKLKLILLILPLLTFIGTIDVYGVTPQPGPVPVPCECEDNLCTSCRDSSLFTICDKRSKNCTTIGTDTINNNQKYDLFEIKDKEIYLDNAEITLELNNVWSALEYKIHISGTNKITYLNSINQRKIMEPALVQEYPDLYSKDYIPFSVVGDGTLDIDVANQIKKNAEGEIYYTHWKVAEKQCKISNNQNMSSDDVKLLNNIRTVDPIYKAGEPLSGAYLTEASVNADNNSVTFTIPKYGYTVSDIKRIFGSNAESFYKAVPGDSITMQEFNEAPPRLLKSYAEASDNVLTADGRIAFIDKLIQSGKNTGSLECGDSYLVPLDPSIEETQITAAWGLENIKTDLRRSFSSDGHYLINFPEEKNMITTTKKDNIVFESTEEFDPNYHLVVDDITEKITDIQSANVQAKTDKTLVELYDIYMADENDNIVKMENGTYKIKIELNDLLKKYENYQIIYIGDDNKVELIDATVEGNYITFNTTHLSKYGVVGKEIRKTGNIITNPQTADSVVTYGLAFASLAVAIALVVLRIRKLKKAN